MEKLDCPYIVFKSAGRLFTLNSANVLAIQEMPNVEAVPQAPDGMRGIFIFHGDVAPVFDFRWVLGESSMESEANQFTVMLEARKQDHINWMNKLRECARSKAPFPLATDPHKCAFGKWYDTFETDNGAVKVHLRKIEQPHKELHETAVKVMDCVAQNGKCDVEQMLETAQKKYVNNVLHILEEAKGVFDDSFREMALVMSLDGKLCALAVDEVLSIDELSLAGGKDSIASISNTSLVSDVRQSERYPGSLIIELDEAELANHFGLS